MHSKKSDKICFYSSFFLSTILSLCSLFYTIVLFLFPPIPFFQSYVAARQRRTCYPVRETLFLSGSHSLDHSLNFSLLTEISCAFQTHFAFFLQSSLLQIALPLLQTDNTVVSFLFLFFFLNFSLQKVDQSFFFTVGIIIFWIFQFCCLESPCCCTLVFSWWLYWNLYSCFDGILLFFWKIRLLGEGVECEFWITVSGVWMNDQRVRVRKFCVNGRTVEVCFSAWELRWSSFSFSFGHHFELLDL